jgi:hypothetical protein
VQFFIEVLQAQVVAAHHEGQELARLQTEHAQKKRARCEHLARLVSFVSSVRAREAKLARLATPAGGNLSTERPIVDMMLSILSAVGCWR